MLGTRAGVVYGERGGMRWAADRPGGRHCGCFVASLIKPGSPMTKSRQGAFVFERSYFNRPLHFLSWPLHFLDFQWDVAH